jgi:maleylpyruvate isomerase
VSVPEKVPTILALLEATSGALLADAERLSEDDLRAASTCPGWSRAHVLAHLINQADAYRRMAWGAAHELTLQQYPGGHEQREAEVERNATWPAETLHLELRRSADELAEILDRLPEPAWTHTVIRVNGPMPLWQALQARLLEVVFHHLDLDTGHTPGVWPAGLVDLLLPDIAAGYERRTRSGHDQRWQLERSDGAGAWTLGSGEQVGSVRGPGAPLMAWLMGRGSSAGLVIDGDRATAEAIPVHYPYGSQYRP